MHDDGHIDLKKFAFDVTWVIISSLSILLVGFLLRVVLARKLGAEDLGLYTLILTIQEITSLIAGFGIPVAITKFAAEYKTNENKISELVFSGLSISFLSGLIVAVLLFSLSGVVSELFHMGPLSSLLRIYCLAIPFSTLLDTFISLSNGVRAMKTFALLSFLRGFLIMLFAVVFMWTGFGIKGVLYAIVLSTIIGCVVGYLFSRKYIRNIFTKFMANSKQLISFGIRIFGANALGLITSRVDIVMLGYYSTATELGFYGGVLTIATLFDIIPLSIQRISFPATAELWRDNDRSSLLLMMDKLMKYSACILLPLALGVGFFSREILSIAFGPSFGGAALPLQIILIMKAIVGSLMVPIGGSFSGIGRPDIELKIGVVSSIVGVILSVVLISKFGITGAALSVCLSQLIRAGIYFGVLSYMVGIKIDSKWNISVFAMAGISIGVFWVETQSFNQYLVGASILFTFIFLLWTLFLTREDKISLRRMAVSIFSKGSNKESTLRVR